MTLKQDLRRATAREAAKRIAKDEGKNWLQMTGPERAEASRAASGKESADDRKKAILILAKKEAKNTNREWRTMPKEERQALLTWIRSES